MTVGVGTSEKGARSAETDIARIVDDVMREKDRWVVGIAIESVGSGKKSTTDVNNINNQVKKTTPSSNSNLDSSFTRNMESLLDFLGAAVERILEGETQEVQLEPKLPVVVDKEAEKIGTSQQQPQPHPPQPPPSSSQQQIQQQQQDPDHGGNCSSIENMADALWALGNCLASRSSSASSPSPSPSVPSVPSVVLNLCLRKKLLSAVLAKLLVAAYNVLQEKPANAGCIVKRNRSSKTAAVTEKGGGSGAATRANGPNAQQQENNNNSDNQNNQNNKETTKATQDNAMLLLDVQEGGPGKSGGGPREASGGLLPEKEKRLPTLIPLVLRCLGSFLNVATAEIRRRMRILRGQQIIETTERTTTTTTSSAEQPTTDESKSFLEMLDAIFEELEACSHFPDMNISPSCSTSSPPVLRTSTPKSTNSGCGVVAVVGAIETTETGTTTTTTTKSDSTEVIVSEFDFTSRFLVCLFYFLRQGQLHQHSIFPAGSKPTIRPTTAPATAGTETTTTSAGQQPLPTLSTNSNSNNNYSYNSSYYEQQPLVLRTECLWILKAWTDLGFFWAKAYTMMTKTCFFWANASSTTTEMEQQQDDDTNIKSNAIVGKDLKPTNFFPSKLSVDNANASRTSATTTSSKALQKSKKKKERQRKREERERFRKNRIERRRKIKRIFDAFVEVNGLVPQIVEFLEVSNSLPEIMVTSWSSSSSKNDANGNSSSRGGTQTFSCSTNYNTNLKDDERALVVGAGKDQLALALEESETSNQQQKHTAAESVQQLQARGRNAGGSNKGILKMLVAQSTVTAGLGIVGNMAATERNPVLIEIFINSGLLPRLYKFLAITEGELEQQLEQQEEEEIVENERVNTTMRNVDSGNNQDQDLKYPTNIAAPGFEFVATKTSSASEEHSH